MWRPREKCGRGRLSAALARRRRRRPPGDLCLPCPRRDYRLEAIRAIDGLNADRLNNAHVQEIANAIHGNTAAPLHLADTIARTNTTV
ncbi:hypothetical protein [Streptomyces sp. MK37H]|uniref:hypothetical protein n=1 Tax=Streptomyces sp. MK37H TaxID=2699117 RepID=UPI001B375C4B|nr:hypothetical protein [Streptomyces sp. MK37H]MBP8536671.1 hypothetical protein [Streptomyces sp. MK37H]